MRRLNVKLAVWLVVVTVISVVGVHFLHGFQVKRNAEFLKVQAEQAREAGNINEAISKYNQFLRYRDDRDGYKALSELVVEVANEAGATRRDKLRAYNILEEAIRRHDDLDEVRASLVDYTIMMRRTGDALEHIDRIQTNRGNKAVQEFEAANPGGLTREKEDELRAKAKDPELEYKAALCLYLQDDKQEAREKLYELVGIDKATEEFKEERPDSAGEIDAYTLLSRVLLDGNDADKQRADVVMNQLVVWNPDSATAHLTRARYIMTQWQTNLSATPEERQAMLDEATAELAKAQQLAPDDVDVMLTSASLEMLAQNLRQRDGQQPDFTKAEQLLDRALEKYPERADVYLRRAELAAQKQDKPKAAQELEAGLKNAEETSEILKALVEVQFELPDLAGARSTCEKMRKVDSIPLELIRYQEARLKLSDGKIVEGARELEQVRPSIERLNPKYAQYVNSYLSRCYEMLGRPDKQLEVNRRLLAAYPDLLVARVGIASALQALGRHAEAEPSVALLVSGAQHFPRLLPTILQLAVAQESSKPADERNWEGVDKIAKLMADSGQQDPLTQQLLQAELLIARGQAREAVQILNVLRKQHPDDKRVWMAQCKGMVNDPEYSKQVPRLLEIAESKFGAIPVLYQQQIRTAASDRENGSQTLQQLEAGLDKFEDKERQALTAQLGTAYLQVGDYENGRRCLMTTLKQDPTNGRLRKLLFEMAMERSNDAHMDEILKELRESPSFGTEDPLYKYCVASRKLRQFSKRRADKEPITDQDHELLSEARKLVDEAIAVRGEWAPLWRARGEVEQLDGNVEGAIANYQKSMSYSQSNQEATARRLVTLLYAAKRYSEANEAMKLLSEGDLPDNMRKLVEDNLRKAGNPQEALAMAKQDIVNDPENPSNYIWYGELLQQDGQTDQAEKVFERATKVAPKLAAAWEFYVRRLIGNKKKNEAVEAVRQATAELGDEPLVLARLNQRVGDFQQAEALYKQALDKSPDDLMVLRHMVEFFLASGQSDRGLEFLDRIIEQGGKSGAEDADSHVAWARRRKAQSLAQLGGYDHVMQAIQMIETNAKGGELDVADKLSIVALLGDRNDPKSRAKTIDLLEQLQAKPGLDARQLTALGRLYNANGDWDKARQTLLAAIDSESEDPEVFTLFGEMSFDHGEFDDAGRYADTAESILAKSPAKYSERVRLAARLLRAKLLKHEGKTDEAVALMEDLLPRPLPQNQLAQLDSVAKQMEQLGLYEGAEKILEEYVSLDPRGAIAMAAFQGRRGNIDKAFALLEESRNSEPAIQVLPVANEILRLYPDAATPERYKLLESWAQSAMETQTNPQRVKLLLAELYDMQGQYDKVEKIYREVLNDPLTKPVDMAQVQNNLAFILAIANPTPARGAEALKLVESAIDFLGPLSDLLDTRALAYLAQGNTEQAAKDLRLAAADRPSTTKYYHLAQVEKRLGNMDAARDALAKAQELRGEHNTFTPVERQGYEQLRQELN